MKLLSKLFDNVLRRQLDKGLKEYNQPPLPFTFNTEQYLLEEIVDTFVYANTLIEEKRMLHSLLKRALFSRENLDAIIDDYNKLTIV